MKKPTKTKKDKKAAEAKGAKKPGLLGKLVLPVVLGITSFCTVYFLPQSAPPASNDHLPLASHEVQGGEAAEPAPIETSFITLESFTVSLKDRTHIMRLSITIEAPQHSAELIDPNNPKLRDAFMGYLSALGMEQVEDAAFLVRLRAQLTRRAKFVLGQDNVQNILITDFMVR